MIIVLNLTSLCHLAWLNSSYDICLFRIKNKMRCLCLPLLWLLKTIHNSWWFGYLNQENYFLPHWDAFQSFFFFFARTFTKLISKSLVCFQLLFPFLFIFIYLFLFLAALGLRCMQAFSSCCKQGLLFVAVHGLLIAVASLVAEHGL